MSPLFVSSSLSRVSGYCKDRVSDLGFQEQSSCLLTLQKVLHEDEGKKKMVASNSGLSGSCVLVSSRVRVVKVLVIRLIYEACFRLFGLI